MEIFYGVISFLIFSLSAIIIAINFFYSPVSNKHQYKMTLRSVLQPIVISIFFFDTSLQNVCSIDKVFFFKILSPINLCFYCLEIPI